MNPIRKRPWLLVLAAALAVTLLGAADRPAVAPDHLQRHIDYLASPAMKGRGTGTPELDRAADYIANQFKQAGLEPLAAGSYFQTFEVTVGAKLGRNNRAEMLGTAPGQAARALRLETDYLPLNFSESGSFTLPLAFAGYGITSDEYRYDDYAHFDVRDKAVIVLRHEPQEDYETSIFAGRELTLHANIVNKAINARQHGARAMILVNDPVPHATEPDELIRFGTLTGPANAGLLVVQMKREVVDALLQPAGKSLAELQKAIDEKLEPQSLAIEGATLVLHVDVQRIHAKTRNVAGVLRGADPALKDEAIVIGAHYDHLGLGQRGSLAPDQVGQVHPGADDNASGTATLLELARQMAAERNELKRSVVFLAFSGEELGLLGSAHYVKEPLWPLERTATMVNIDMVGRLRENKLYVGGIGTSPTFREIVTRANQQDLALTLNEGGGGSSDHVSFYSKNVPVLFFFSGLHADYHKPSDTPDRIHGPDLARVFALIHQATRQLARLESRPEFVKVQEQIPAVAGTGGGYGAYFGSIPDMGEEVAGVKFADIRPGSPAAQAGLQPGDILVNFAEMEIRNLYDFTYALRRHKPGEEVNVTVLRGEQRLTVKVTLGVRR